MTDIPIYTAAYIAKDFGYDQIIIVGRKIGQDGNEHVTTYGVDKENCDVAARIGDFLKYKIMLWARTPILSDSLSAGGHIDE